MASSELLESEREGERSGVVGPPSLRHLSRAMCTVCAQSGRIESAKERTFDFAVFGVGRESLLENGCGRFSLVGQAMMARTLLLDVRSETARVGLDEGALRGHVRLVASWKG